MHARGSVSGELVIWLATLLAAVIVVLWFFGTLGEQGAAADEAHETLARIAYAVDDACPTAKYATRIRPFVESGRIRVSDENGVCLTAAGTQLCRKTLCTQVAEADANFDQARAITVRKQSADGYVEVDVQ